jgi:hypothetical protein
MGIGLVLCLFRPLLFQSLVLGQSHLSSKWFFWPLRRSIGRVDLRKVRRYFSTGALRAVIDCFLGRIHKSRTRDVGTGRTELGGSHMCDCCACDYSAMLVGLDATRWKRRWTNATQGLKTQYSVATSKYGKTMIQNVILLATSRKMGSISQVIAVITIPSTVHFGALFAHSIWLTDCRCATTFHSVQHGRLHGTLLAIRR